LIEKIGLDVQYKTYFYLFEVIDSTFERKLRPNEQLYLIYMQNFTNKNTTCIRMKKWYFNLKCESQLAKNTQTLKYLFHQAVEDFDREQIKMPENYEIDLNFFKENNRYLDYLKNVYKFDGYGETVFPHCPCDSRKNGHVIVIVSSACFKLAACSSEGELESQVVEFSCDDIEKIDVDDEEMAFIIEVKIPNKPNKAIKIYTGFVSFSENFISLFIFL
jgi:sorting nexin-27